MKERTKKFILLSTIIMLVVAVIIVNRTRHAKPTKVGPHAEVMTMSAIAVGAGAYVNEDYGLHIIIDHPMRPGVELEIRAKTIWWAVRRIPPVAKGGWTIDREVGGFPGWDYYDEEGKGE